MSNNTSQQNVRHRLQFHGKGGEYFTIWLVNTLLSAITLGIYSAWATVRRRRYFYGNTELNGDRFDYHAEPLQILKGRLLVVAGVIVFYILLAISPMLGLVLMLAFMALIPWIIIRNWRYNAIMSSYRGVRFNYHCRTGRAYWALLFCPLLLIIGLYIAALVLVFAGKLTGTSSGIITMSVITVLLLIPGFAAVNGIIQALQNDLYINNMLFGNMPFNAELKKSAFIKIALISILIFLPFLIGAMFLIGSFISGIVMAGMMGDSSDAMVQSLLLSNVMNLFLMVVVLLIGTLFASSYQVVALRNYLFNQTQLKGGIKLHSSMQTLPYMGLLITNSLITIFSMGFAAPVAEVRHARYLANATEVEGDLSLIGVQAHTDTAKSALAEEVVQAFDLGTGF
ncbi:DUF898 family protein [Affinibrenneria salicis]|uniref:DUF898 family protein n=1 Tax=Affinibrenneria salicis TaxID=2590031 RepID=A0A5J5FZK6_9GAMM|nr:DUF898 family protein [Affinibrenneria salicis]KAA8999326.1 DUF898 family protein [Affinibrenneria salicis]